METRQAAMPPDWLAAWRWMLRANELRWVRALGDEAMASVVQARLRALLRTASMKSRFYQELHHGVVDPHAATPTLASLPVARKHALMERFDDWVTDPCVTRRGVEAFLASRSTIGTLYQNRCDVWKSSGSTGEPGIFVHDLAALAVYDALLMTQLERPPIAARYAAGVAQGGRGALITATGDHFASIAASRRLRRGQPWLPVLELSVTAAPEHIIGALNRFCPAFLASYPTMLTLLAGWQAEGKLRIRPACIWAGGETLSAARQAAIEQRFGCPVVNEYGASEFFSIGFGCAEGWLHLNADWAILEPVDAQYRPVPAGRPSHTALLTNLANHLQPLIRYDIGDSILMRNGPCPCGSRLPAFRVEGRAGDVVSLEDGAGSTIRLSPLALSTVVEEAADLHRFQIVQTASDALRLRVERGGGSGQARRAKKAVAALKRYLQAQHLQGVHVQLDDAPPAAEPRSGKLRDVLVNRP